MSKGRGKFARGRKRAAIMRVLKDFRGRVRLSTDAPDSQNATIQFLDADGNEIETITVVAGVSILAIAAKANIEIDHFCGGQCSCGTCRINVLNGASNLSKMTGMEEMVLGANHTRNGCRLACQARVEGPAAIQVPRWF